MASSRQPESASWKATLASPETCCGPRVLISAVRAAVILRWCSLQQRRMPSPTDPTTTASTTCSRGDRHLAASPSLAEQVAPDPISRRRLGPTPSSPVPTDVSTTRNPDISAGRERAGRRPRRRGCATKSPSGPARPRPPCGRTHPAAEATSTAPAVAAAFAAALSSLAASPFAVRGRALGKSNICLPAEPHMLAEANNAKPTTLADRPPSRRRRTPLAACVPEWRHPRQRASSQGSAQYFLSAMPRAWTTRPSLRSDRLRSRTSRRWTLRSIIMQTASRRSWQRCLTSTPTRSGRRCSKWL